MRTTFYEIKDRSGAIVALHKRVDRDDGSKEMAWLQPDGTSGLNGTPAAALPLYGAHRLAEWPDGAAVVLGEGEKVAEALWSIGVPAVATVCGAAVKPEASVLADLSGRPVICAPDNDTLGREHMTYNADTLADVAAVAWLEPDGRPDKWDLADAAAAGEDVRELLRAAVAWPLPVAYRTLADIDETPPAPLLLGMLERDGSTLLYAAPGTGKGLTGAWIVRELMEVGMRPAIFDAECRPKEWSRRVAGLGGDRSRVVYIEPVDLGPKLAGQPLWEAIDGIRPILRSAGADVLLVDSILPAVGVGEERLRSDAQAPFLYVAALDSLGMVTASTGHPPKSRPEGDPYGSMAWLAAHRMTWLGTDAATDEGKRIRWRPRKRNERGHIDGKLLHFEFADAGRAP